jgi:hypothetical protein
MGKPSAEGTEENKDFRNLIMPRLVRLASVVTRLEVWRPGAHIYLLYNDLAFQKLPQCCPYSRSYFAAGWEQMRLLCLTLAR